MKRKISPSTLRDLIKMYDANGFILVTEKVGQEDIFTFDRDVIFYEWIEWNDESNKMYGNTVMSIGSQHDQVYNRYIYDIVNEVMEEDDACVYDQDPMYMSDWHVDSETKTSHVIIF